MSAITNIQWTKHTWNFIAAFLKSTGKRGWFCTKRTKACGNCYAADINKRLGNGLDYTQRNLELIRFEVMENLLLAPLKWKPAKIFVNSMTDFFHPAIPDWMRRIGFAAMMACPKHTFQILTKQPEQMEKFFQENTLGDCYTEAQHYEETKKANDPFKLAARLRCMDRGMAGGIPAQWPLPNVHICVSCGDQADADLFIPILLRVPAAVRGISAEPLLGPIELTRNWTSTHTWHDSLSGKTGMGRSEDVEGQAQRELTGKKLDWVIVGGESGPRARACSVNWIRSIVAQCKDAAVPCFVKQLGKWPLHQVGDRQELLQIKDPKGGNPAEWPTDLRVREFPLTSPIP